MRASASSAAMAGCFWPDRSRQRARFSVFAGRLFRPYQPQSSVLPKAAIVRSTGIAAGVTIWNLRRSKREHRPRVIKRMERDDWRVFTAVSLGMIVVFSPLLC